MKTSRRFLIGLACTFAISFAWGRTGTVSVAEDPQAQGQLVVSFANHANETNGLWVAYGVADRGETTNDWDTVAFVQTVKPETESLTYPLPTGWGSSVRAIRFFLSEVPYDVDYTLTYLQSDQGQRIVLNKFKFMGSYRLVTKMRQTQCNSTASPAFFSCRDGGNVVPYFGLFQLKGPPAPGDSITMRLRGVLRPRSRSRPARII